jgi:hypothetical protein
MTPTIGRIVLFRSRTGKYTIPAIVNCTIDTIYQPGVDGGHVPAITSPNNVHLTVFTPGKPGQRGNAADFENPSKHPIGENVAGCYQEWDVEQWEQVEGAEQPAGTWMWPPRV